MNDVSAFEIFKVAFTQHLKNHDGLSDTLNKETQEALQSLCLPNKKDEAWKYTSLRSWKKTTFALNQGPQTFDLASLADPRAENAFLLNGRLQEKATSTPFIKSWNNQSQPARWNFDTQKGHFHRKLNHAFQGEGFLLEVPNQASSGLLKIQNIITDEPTNRDKPKAQFSYSQIHISDNANAKVILENKDLRENPSTDDLCSAIFDIKLGKNASLELVTLDHDLELSAFQGFYISQEENSELKFLSGAANNHRQKQEIFVKLAGDHALCSLHGVTRTGDQQHIDQSVEIHHAAPHTSSNQNFRSIVAGKAQNVMQSAIQISSGAKKSTAHQVNKVLLLDSVSQAFSKPVLEVDEDDVRCSHGSAIGQISQESLFYLQSRGIPKEQAINILSGAFLEEILIHQANNACFELISEPLRKALEGGF